MFALILVVSLAASNFISNKLQKPISEPKVDLIASVPEGVSVAPGEVIDYAPYIQNTCEGNVYTAIIFECAGYDSGAVEMDEKYVADEDPEDPIPAFLVNTNDCWVLKDTSIADGTMKRIYLYTEILAPGESTPPLCDSIQFNLFSIRSFSKMDRSELNTSISCCAANSDMVSIERFVDMCKYRE